MFRVSLWGGGQSSLRRPFNIVGVWWPIRTISDRASEEDFFFTPRIFHFFLLLYGSMQRAQGQSIIKCPHSRDGKFGQQCLLSSLILSLPGSCF